MKVENINVLLLAIAVTVLSCCDCLLCDKRGKVGGCVCDPQHGGAVHVYCPRRWIRNRGENSKRLEIVWHQHYQKGRNFVKTTCSGGSTSADILRYVSSLELERIERLVIKKCPGLDQVLFLNLRFNTSSEVVFSQTRQEETKAWKSFQGQESIRKLDIIYQKHLVLGETSFEHNRQVKHLSLRGNKGIVIHQQTLSVLSDLESLDLSNCHILDIPKDLLSKLPNLKRLNLHGNNLASLPDDIVSSLTLLEEINLSSNELLSLPVQVFHGLSHLSTLYISCNHFQHFPTHLLSNNSLVKRFSIDNSICFNKTLPSHNLVLPESMMSSLRIQAIPSGRLNNCSNLNSLTITRSKLSSVPGDMFFKTCYQLRSE